MTSTIQSLTAHKNTLERKRKRELAQSLTLATKKLVKDNDVRAYAVVTINADGNGSVLWDTGKILPMWAFPETIAAILRRDVENCEMADDWKPQIPSARDR